MWGKDKTTPTASMSETTTKEATRWKRDKRTPTVLDLIQGSKKEDETSGRGTGRDDEAVRAI